MTLHNIKLNRLFMPLALVLAFPLFVNSQAMYQKSATIPSPVVNSTSGTDSLGTTKPEKLEAAPSPDDLVRRPTPQLIALRKEAMRKEAERKAFEAHIDSIINLDFDIENADFPLLPPYFFAPAVYTNFSFPDSLAVTKEKTSEPVPSMKWITQANELNQRINDRRYRLFFGYPEAVRYNIATLPDAPKKYHSILNPENHTITIEEINVKPVNEANIAPSEYEKRHWIKRLNTRLQFSQAYISPNWYQGGEKNLNAIGEINYNVSLNKKFHPDLLFETTVFYKAGINSAPNDSLHSYNIMEDIFQLNTTFGLKAHGNWYYSFTGQFKTQLLHSYKSNTNDLKSAFLSPGELTVGVGMTYNRQNAAKTFQFDLSLSPISYNLRTCINRKMNPQNFDIKEGHKTISKYGSTLEAKLRWQMFSNISLDSRVYCFTDYSRLQGDWEMTLVFRINRYLTSQIYTHLRFDDSTKKDPDSDWDHWQFKEIFSIGLSYNFSSF